MNSVKEITIFAASEAFASVSEQLIRQRNLLNHIAVVKSTGESTLKNAESLVKAGSKIFISRGRNTSLLKKHMTIPIIDVPYLYEEVYASVEAAGCRPEKIAMVGFDKAYDIMETFRKLSGQEVQLISPESPDTAEMDIIKELRPGTQALIGGFSAKRVAELHHLKLVPLMVEAGNISMAIDSALNILTSIEKKDEYLKTIFTTVNRIPNAVFNYDGKGELLFSNERAVTIFGDITQRKIKELLFPEAMGKKFAIPMDGEIYDYEGGVQKERIIKINFQNYIAEYIPVIVHNRFKSTVVIVSSENSIQSAEKKLRLNQNERGYTAKNSFQNIVGKSAAIRETIHLAERYARSNSAVLITGETGTGKELFAQSIHNKSSRVQEPFVAINCAALPESLLESELFGYVKGAFTGANKEGKMGIFEMAHKGTVFMDEIGEMALEVQAKLLRVLQEKEVCRLGDDRIIPVDIRILSATNKDLPALVKEKKFREDLLYRLNVLELHLPPLRERQEDIPYLINAYMEKSGHPLVFSDEAVSLLCEELYPGNIRQLFNFLERIVVLAETDYILPEDLVGIISDSKERLEDKTSLDQTVEDYERKKIKKCLIKNRGSRAKTAFELNISPATLWRKMKKYDIF